MEDRYSQSFVIKEAEQLLNTVVEYFACNGQTLKVGTKEEQLLINDIEGFVDDGRSLRTVNLGDNQNKQGLLLVVVGNEDIEDYAEFLGEIPSEMVSL